ncbi:hypothetical protein D9611_000916 [Ephemerocybe angulata]|uniref:Endonuclease/exonuclease/phosphatase domain-containing protein n=1 Tax=Ephemerocybe angulata TaxID=980116 RepID=A0A8H5F6N4_9AGAR|nr:hypothetical protein D9611_000916 [Tulosesus angulatus]
MSIPWNNHKSTLNFLAIYAPNNERASEDLWRDVKTYYDDKAIPKKPHFVLGDFNLVEDEIDRRPAHRDDTGAVDTLKAMLRALRMQDGFRKEYPDRCAFTWGLNHSPDSIPPNASLSRIDRIYCRRDMYFSTREWRIHLDHTVGTDHELVSATYYNLDAPFIGKGRWQIPGFLLDCADFMEQVNDLCALAIAK